MRQGFTTIQDYKAFFARRQRQIVVPFLIIFGLITLVALLLPPVYRSASTILIENQQIPQDLIRTTVTSYVEERLKLISQEIMGRARLLEIINRFGLYEDLRARYTTEEIVDGMRKDIALEMVSAETTDRRTGRPAPVTVAFTLSYEGKDPHKVQNVANAVASLYLEANLKTRTTMAETSVTFLEKQAELYRNQCAELEKKIAEFKEKHLGALPELLQLNLQTEQQMRTQLDNVDRDIRTLQDRKVYLEGQLATVKPDSPLVDETGRRVLDTRERLKLMRSEQVSLKAHFSEGHPDVVRVSKTVRELEHQVKTKDDLQRKRKELTDKKAALEQLMGRVTEKHPDVVRLKGEVARYEKEIEQGEKTSVPAASGAEEPDNPAYISLKTQVASTELELGSLKKKREDIHQKWLAYLHRLENMPRVERGYTDLSRDYDNARAKYREITDKVMVSRQSLSLEEVQAGEKFTIVEPAQFPEKPEKPNRLAITLIGFILGLGAAVGYASVVEFSDTSPKNADDLQAITGLPVLAVIPRILTEEEEIRQGKKMYRYVITGVTVLIAGLLLFHFFVMDLELLWIKVLRKLG